MFLLVRSAMCIALVVSALPERPATGPATAAFDTIAVEAGGAVAASIDRFCRHDPSRCLRAVDSLSTAPGARTGRVSARSGAPAGAAGI